MKYLRAFENYKSSDINELHQTIKDILLELNDDGFRCYCNLGYDVDGPSFEVRVYLNDEALKHGRKLNFNEVEEQFKRIYNILMEYANGNVEYSFIINNIKEYRYSLKKYGFDKVRSTTNYLLTKEDYIMVYFDLR